METANHKADGRVIAASVISIIASAYPALSIGALATVLREDLNMAEWTFGLLVSCFFAGSAVGSVRTSQISERHGVRSTVTWALTGTAIVDLVLFGFGSEPWVFAAAMFGAGVCNSAAHPAVNKLLSDSVRRGNLGKAISIKQSGMPAASMLGGIAVPVFALTIGWQFSYATGAAMALFSIWAIRTVTDDDETTLGEATESRPKGTLDSPVWVLQLAAVAALFGAASAGTTTTWITTSATEAGISDSTAGLLLSLSAGIAICIRIGSGVFADRNPNVAPMKISALALAIGACGCVPLLVSSQVTQVIGALLAMGIGWTWPAMFNFAVLKANPDGPARASGITQVGVYLGVLSGAPLMGFVLRFTDFSRAWILTAALMAAGAMILRIVSPKVSGAKEN